MCSGSFQIPFWYSYVTRPLPGCFKLKAEVITFRQTGRLLAGAMPLCLTGSIPLPKLISNSIDTPFFYIYYVICAIRGFFDRVPPGLSRQLSMHAAHLSPIRRAKAYVSRNQRTCKPAVYSHLGTEPEVTIPPCRKPNYVLFVLGHTPLV